MHSSSLSVAEIRRWSDKLWTHNLEVFNLMGFKNVNSYYWVTDIYNHQMAIPNYLTGRQLNLKVMVDLK